MIKPARGFTLTELAVVLVIVSFLMGGLLIPLSAQKNIEARRATGQALANINEALMGFAATHGRLPCPAEGGLATGTPNAGLEAFNGSACTCSGTSAVVGGTACTSNSTVGGVLPWATLGVQETDAWNSRYTYRVTTTYARSVGQSTFACDSGLTAPSSSNSAFALCSSGLISVTNVAGGALTAQNEAPAIIVSHGDNGLGAWLSTGVTKPGVTGNEALNADGDANFISDSSVDDMLIWVSRSILMNRMISAGKLP